MVLCTGKQKWSKSPICDQYAPDDLESVIIEKTRNSRENSLFCVSGSKITTFLNKKCMHEQFQRLRICPILGILPIRRGNTTKLIKT